MPSSPVSRQLSRRFRLLDLDSFKHQQIEMIFSRRLAGFIAAGVLLLPAVANSEEHTNPLDRLITEAKSDPGWAQATTAGKVRLIRETALKKDVVSTPVSDRYLITVLGGPIDLVHFLGLTIVVCSGSAERDKALLDQWKDEGGEDFEAKRTRSFPTEAHPDDLPSNAFGALFGEEIRNQNNRVDFDVTAALLKFLAPLEPVPDAIAKKFSHRRIVMGLSDDATRETIRSRSEWFTAQPLFSLYAFDAKRAKRLGNSVGALRKAGFSLRSLEGKPIAIDRLSPRK